MSIHIPKRFGRYVLTQVGVQSLLVVGILVFGFLLAEDTFFRWDLTEDSRFTISEASHELARELEDPLTIRAFFSANLPPHVEPLQGQVFDVLDEYAAASGGKIKIERYDPTESQTAENEAKNYGIRPVQLAVYEATAVQGLQVYGSIVLVYRDRASEVINVAERYPHGYEGLSVLEYEISSKIWQLSHERPQLGLTGHLQGPPQQSFPGGPAQGMPQPEFRGLRSIIGEAFEVVDVDLKQESLDPEKVPLLLVVRPREFSDVEVFRLDQYLMKGGRVLMFVTQGTVQASAWDPNLRWQQFDTGLDAWLEHHGLRIPKELVLHYANCNPIQVRVDLGGGLAGSTTIPSWFRPIISAEDALDKDNPAIRTLQSISFFWPHPVDVLEDRVAEGVESTVLVKSHGNESWRWKDLSRIDMRLMDPRVDGPQESDVRASPLAVVLEGDFTSYYAERPTPPSLGTGESEDEGEGEEAAEPKGPEVKKVSEKPGHLVAIGNAIFVSDQVLGGQQVSERAKQATLLAFNLVDWLARSEDLIALRAKKYTNRRIVDTDFKADVESARESAKAGEITAEEYRESWDNARERQKVRQKRSRWVNIIVPCFLVLIAGAFIWILRAASRGRQAPPPPAGDPTEVDRAAWTEE